MSLASAAIGRQVLYPCSQGPPLLQELTCFGMTEQHHGVDKAGALCGSAGAPLVDGGLNPHVTAEWDEITSMKRFINWKKLLSGGEGCVSHPPTPPPHGRMLLLVIRGK